MSHPSAQTHPANAKDSKTDKKEPQTPEEQAAKEQQDKDDGVNAVGQVLAKIAAALLPAGSRVVLTFPVPDQSSAPVARPTLEEQAAQAALDAEGEGEKNGKEGKKAEKDKKDADKKAQEEVLAAIQKLLQPDDEKKDKKKDDAESAKSPEEQKADAQREQLAKLQADARAKSARWEVWRGTGSGQHNGSGRTLAYALKVVDAVIVAEHGALVLVQQDGSPMPKDETQQEREAREAKEKEQQDAQAKADAKAEKKTAA